MKIPWSKLINFFILLLLLLLLSGFQSTFWYQLFGTVQAPMLWLCLIVYVALYRKFYHAIFTTYIMAIALTGFTAMPIKMLLPCLLAVYLILYSIRSRVFWEGPAYYTIMCTLATFSYHVVYFAASWLIERNPTSVNFLDRFIQLALTPAFGIPMFWLLTKIDKMTRDDMSYDSRGFDL
ncbi:MAG: hypothetical protein IPM97_02180 [Bdellovibrionaceae bacterium]|nr:hypothetical protein [Pseudobdellovibrionaceae bacterium]